MVKLGSGSEREIQDYMLTRYACYLIAQNGDPRKEQIAFAQSYFAVQTRKAEIIIEGRLGIKDNRPLADFLPTHTIAAKNLATEMTNYNVEKTNLKNDHTAENKNIWPIR